MGRFLLFLVILTSSLSVSIQEFSIIYTIFFFTAVGVSLIRIPAIGVDPKLVNYYQFLLCSFAIGLFISLPANYIFDSGYRYNTLNPLGRIFNLIGATAVVFYISSALRLDQSIKWYFFSCCIIIASALWHALDLYTSFPIDFPFETRSLVHSASSLVSIESRLTGLAQEPSYLASFLIDFWIFSLIMFYEKRRPLLICRGVCVVLVFLTYSPSAYLSFGVIFLGEMLFRAQTRNRLALIITGIILLALVPIIIYQFQNIDIQALNYFTGRIENAGDSGRFFVISESVRLIFNDGSVFKLLFGNGLKSFELIQLWSPQVNVVTSNNLYIDVFFESGFIGLLVLLLFYVYSLKKIKQIDVFQFRLFAYLLLLDLFLSGFYRADYATLRFFLLFFFIFAFSHHRRFFKVKTTKI